MLDKILVWSPSHDQTAGLSTFFLTLSSADIRWNELISIIGAL